MLRIQEIRREREIADKVLPPLRLQVDEDIDRYTNMLNRATVNRNNLIDRKRRIKKDKALKNSPEGKEEISNINKQIAICDENINRFNQRLSELYVQTEELTNELSYLRLKMFVYAEAFYGILWEYKQFATSNAIGNLAPILDKLDDSKETIATLPFAFGHMGGAVYNTFEAIADKLVERSENIINRVMDDVMTDVGLNLEKYQKNVVD